MIGEYVIPAKAGIQVHRHAKRYESNWAPASAGATTPAHRV